MAFNEKHYDLLMKEFGLSREDMKSIGKEAWQKIREQCMWISADEIIDSGDFPEKAEIAEEIMDTKYSMLEEAIGDR
jgi:hypothetical protein